mgnify:CR=1 FL=1
MPYELTSSPFLFAAIALGALGAILVRLAPDERGRLQAALVDLGRVVEVSQSRPPEIDEEAIALA